RNSSRCAWICRWEAGIRPSGLRTNSYRNSGSSFSLSPSLTWNHDASTARKSAPRSQQQLYLTNRRRIGRPSTVNGMERAFRVSASTTATVTRPSSTGSVVRAENCSFSGMTRPIRCVTSPAKSLASASNLSVGRAGSKCTGGYSPLVAEQVVDAADCLVSRPLFRPQRVGKCPFAQLLICHVDRLKELLSTARKIISAHPDDGRHHWTFQIGRAHV